MFGFFLTFTVFKCVPICFALDGHICNGAVLGIVYCLFQELVACVIDDGS